MPSNVSLQGIEFTIKGSADEASKSVKQLTEDLNALKDALKKSEGITGLATSLKKLENINTTMLSVANTILKEMAQLDFTNIREAAQGIKDIAAAAREVANIGKSDKPVEQIVGEPDKLRTALSYLQEFGHALGAVTQVGAKGLGKVLSLPFKSAISHVKKYAEGLKGVVSSFKRILGYRIIRSIIKGITQAFTEGLKNAYEFSKLTGDQARLAKALDDLATKSLTMKNQLGAAFGGLLTALMPIILKIIQFVTKLAEAITRLIAILGGSDHYLRAKDVWTEWGDAAKDAGGKAKKALEYLAPFDELNVLPDPKSGGSGSNEPNYADMFEYADVEGGGGFLDSIKDMLDKVSNFFTSYDWAGLADTAWSKLKERFSNDGKATEVIKSLFNALGTALGAAASFIIQFVKDAVADIWSYFDKYIKDDNGDGKRTGEEIIKGIWAGIVDAIKGVGKWIKDNIWTPFINGFKEVFKIHSPSEAMMPYGEYIAQGILDGIKSGWKNIKTWVYSNLFQPMIKWVNKYIEQFNKKFGTNLPTIKFNGEVSNVEVSSDLEVTGGGGAFGGGIGGFWAKIKGWITSLDDKSPSSDKTVSGIKGVMDWITDKVPFAQKLIDGIRGNVTKAVDNIPKSEKVVNSTQAIMTTVSNQIPKNYLTIGTTASFATVVNKLSTGQTTFNSTADFKKAQDQMQESAKTFLSTAKMKYVTSALTDKQKTFDSTAKVENYVLGGVSSYNGKMRVDSVIDIKGQTNVPTIAVDIAPTASAGSANVSNKPTSSFSVKANGGAFYGGLWHSIAQYASGGFPNHGSLFVAGENGSELVSHIGGRTEVLNQSQIASAVASGVSRYLTMGAADGGNEDAMYRAFKRALDETDFSGDVELDGQTLYKAMVNRNRQNTRLTGVNAMA